MKQKITRPSSMDGASPARGRNISHLRPNSLNARSVVCPPAAPYSGTIRRTRPLTDRQREVLAYVAQHIRAFGAPPTIREIGTAMGLASTNGVSDHLHALERKGCLVRRRDKTRSLQLTEAGWKAAAGGDLVQTFELTLEEYVAEHVEAWRETLSQHGVPDSVDDVSAYIEARTEAVQEHAASAHRVAVIDAWHTGCVVPERVLADYPELRGAA